MTDLTTVLNAIDGLRSDYREDLRPVWKAVNENSNKMNETKIKVTKLEGRHDLLAKEVQHAKRVNNLFSEHLGNNDSHFDKKKAQETTLGYWAKKRMLIILLTALAAIVSAATGAIIYWLNTLGG